MPKDSAASIWLNVDSLNPGPEVLGLIGRIERTIPRPITGLHGAELDAEVGQDKIDVEQLHDDRQPANHIDHANGEQCDGADFETIISANIRPKSLN